MRGKSASGTTNRSPIRASSLYVFSCPCAIIQKTRSLGRSSLWSGLLLISGQFIDHIGSGENNQKERDRNKRAGELLPAGFFYENEK
jgi:hypothetical protein